MKSIIVVVGVALSLPARADTQRLTFQAAIELTVTKSPDVAIAAEAVSTAQEKASGLKAKRLPNARVDEHANLYREPYQLPFGGMTFTLYERETTLTMVTISEPLTGLAYLSELVGAAEHGATAARADYDRARLDAVYRTADAYIRVLGARAVADVAHRTVADIESELQNAQKLRAADTYTDIDVLRFKSAKAAAEQEVVRSDTASEAAIAQLVLAIGLHDAEPIDVVDDLPAPPPPLAMTIAQAQDRAAQTRPELRAAHERIAAADDTRVATRETYLPDIRAVGVYTHATGVQPFQPEDVEYLGLEASWNVWDWGATHQAVKQAEHAQVQAALTEHSLADQIRLDVRTRWLDARAAFDSLALIETQLQTAEEAYRLQQVRFSAGASTTTDVLDAETDVARGRLRFAQGRYAYYSALVGLARAIGDVPSVAK